ncbi:hypothetical protein [Parasphingorhabdus sp.]|uniref:hypothetical protein n=1 Tax=Parasphingorhabdus sp. TaxID=2709688 RepID=UPI003267386C
MKKLFSAVLGIAAMSIPSTASAAGGWTNDVIPTKVEIVRNQGFLIFGAFGNLGSTPCATGDPVWVANTHSEYTELLSSALTAVAGQLKLRIYAHNCATVSWHGTDYNQLTSSGAMYVSR